MKIIPVKVRNKKASTLMLVDDEDYNTLELLKWHLATGGYAQTKIKKNPLTLQRPITAHRIILWCPQYLQIDHIDGNPLNNQKKNLRICSGTQNQRNRKRMHNNKSGFKGVSLCKNTKKWRATIKTDDQLKYLGLFNTPEEAHDAYKQAAIKFHGEFAKW